MCVRVRVCVREHMWRRGQYSWIFLEKLVLSFDHWVSGVDLRSSNLQGQHFHPQNHFTSRVRTFWDGVKSAVHHQDPNGEFRTYSSYWSNEGNSRESGSLFLESPSPTTSRTLLLEHTELYPEFLCLRVTVQVSVSRALFLEHSVTTYVCVLGTLGRDTFRQKSVHQLYRVFSPFQKKKK